MRQTVLRLTAICAALMLIPSCGSKQRLIAINITPAAIVFGSESSVLSAQLTALGEYAHPPATKDLTTLVTWSSTIPGVAVVTSSGVVSPAGSDCGVATITATYDTNNPTGNLITGTIPVTVDGPPALNCPTTTPSP